jgi:hypothetical protein
MLGLSQSVEHGKRKLLHRNVALLFGIAQQLISNQATLAGAAVWLDQLNECPRLPSLPV